MSITVTMREAKDRLTELARLAEAGETVTLVRNGKPVASIVAHTATGEKGFDQEAGQRWLRENGLDTRDMIPSPDFDDPLPEDFLVNPVHRPSNG